MIKKKYIFPLLAMPAMITLNSCMDEVQPVSYLTAEQVEASSTAQKSLLDGIVAFMNTYNTWGGDEYYTNDWGYPCQMMFRDALTADFPATASNYNYWANVETSQQLESAAYYTYKFYYTAINNCNLLVGNINPEGATTTELNYLGCALTFRALFYFDMARMFEFQKTGYSSLDASAEAVDGLTVSIVTDKTTDAEMKNNPRAPFYTMYRFILTDLNDAEEYLSGYKRTNGTYPDRSVVYGMKARFWLELASRFDKTPADLTTQLSHENDDDGYDALGITTANECYEQAAHYAQLAESGYTPMSESEWRDPSTGFNTATDAWMFYGSVTTKEQEGNYYSSLMGTVCTEAYWGMPQYGEGTYRMIGSALYNKMGSGDWRKLSWISPDDAGKTPDSSNGIEDKYQLAEWSNDDGSVTSTSKFSEYPAYANLKYRTRSCSGYLEGMLCDIPFMRVEEMYFIEAEALAHTNGVATGVAKLNSFMNSYRYTDGSYNCTASDIDSFTDELISQKRIELWGEGLSMFDYKRLKMAVKRTANTNYADNCLIDSKDGYVCPAMNYYILDYAVNSNPAIIQNPSCTGWNNLE